MRSKRQTSTGGSRENAQIHRGGLRVLIHDPGRELVDRRRIGGWRGLFWDFASCRLAAIGELVG